MRRKISLYIDGNLADLDEQSFILFNYTMDDLSNPTIVKNSFSQQVSLPGTPANNAIFGDAYRLDRRVDYNEGASGAGFNPSKKTPFVIYNELDEVLESGYCKLDNVVRRRGVPVAYKVSLYGGLGSFLYNLSYADDGRKLTLADLDYLGNGDPGELDFIINASAIEDAWQDLSDLWAGAEPAPTGKWTVINFAPAYNGFPENFSPDKGIVIPGDVGLPSSEGGYDAANTGGYALVNLSNKMDEWAVKDLRSYLQRPVLSVKAFLNAICNPDNNGGYEVDISDLGSMSFEYDELWLTLPLIPSLGSMKQSGTGLSLTMSTVATTGNDIGRYDIVGSIPTGAMVNATIRCKVRYNTPAGADAYTDLTTGAVSNDGDSSVSSVIFLQLLAYTVDDIIVGGSGVKMVNLFEADAKRVAEACGYAPAFPTDVYERIDGRQVDKVSAGVFELANELTFRVEAQDVAYFKVMAYVYNGQGAADRGLWKYSYSGNGSSSRATLYDDYSTYFQAVSTFIKNGSGNSVTKTDPDQIRSGALVTKQMLLSTSSTPADYLLSFCKLFGLYFICDRAEKKATILTRNSLYVDETIDLTEMVDTSQDTTIVPLLFDSKWYRFALEGVGGEFFDEYKQVEGIEYGIQLVDTGFDFNADIKDLLDGNVYKNAVTILQRSRYWNIITSGGDFIPSPFLDEGNTYSLRNSAGQSKEYQISRPPSSASISYYNNDYNGYDIPNECKLQLHDAEGKPVDGANVLVFLNGFDVYAKFKITDDLPVMSVLNGGKPCWILDEGAGAFMPIFSRYGYEWRFLDYVMVRSLDFGVPRQLDIPGIVYAPSSTVYSVAWKSYLTDRYDVDGKVMRCKVHFNGIQVGPELLRRFYFYDNALWVLNKINNFSLTTFDAVECEFIKVKDKDNYLSGQDY